MADMAYGKKTDSEQSSWAASLPYDSDNSKSAQSPPPSHQNSDMQLEFQAERNIHTKNNNTSTNVKDNDVKKLVTSDQKPASPALKQASNEATTTPDSCNAQQAVTPGTSTYSEVVKGKQASQTPDKKSIHLTEREDREIYKSLLTSYHQELQVYRNEVRELRSECNMLKSQVDSLESLVRINEVKARKEAKALEIDLQDAIDTTAASLFKEQVTMGDQIALLRTAKDSQTSNLVDICNQLNAQSHSSSSPTPESGSVSQKSKSVTVSNKFTAQLVASEDEESDASSSNSSSQNRSTTHKKDKSSSQDSHNDHRGLTPLEQLRKMAVKPNTNNLLIGDSVARSIDERKLTEDRLGAQKLSVSGLRVCDLHIWLNDQPSAPHVQEVIVHVGINDCWNGPISQQEWTALTTRLRKVFPCATLYMSSLVPPRGRHTIRQSACDSHNALLAACQQKKAVFVKNSDSFMAVSGAPKQIMYKDKFHPSDQGARALETNIKNAIRSHRKTNGGHKLENMLYSDCVRRDNGNHGNRNQQQEAHEQRNYRRQPTNGSYGPLRQTMTSQQPPLPPQDMMLDTSYHAGSPDPIEALRMMAQILRPYY